MSNRNKRQEDMRRSEAGRSDDQLMNDASIKLGSREYQVSTITATNPPSYIIKETEIIGGGSIKVKGSIEISSEYFDEFVSKLNSMRR